MVCLLGMVHSLGLLGIRSCNCTGSREDIESEGIGVDDMVGHTLLWEHR